MALEIRGTRAGNTVLTIWKECLKVLICSFVLGQVKVEPPDIGMGSAPTFLEEYKLGCVTSKIRCKRSPRMHEISGEMAKAIWKVIFHVKGDWSGL